MPGWRRPRRLGRRPPPSAGFCPRYGPAGPNRYAGSPATERAWCRSGPDPRAPGRTARTQRVPLTRGPLGRAWAGAGDCHLAGRGLRHAPRGRGSAAPEPTRAGGAGPASHSSIALSTPRPPRSSTPRGPPHPHFRPHGTFLPSHCR